MANDNLNIWHLSARRNRKGGYFPLEPNRPDELTLTTIASHTHDPSSYCSSCHCGERPEFTDAVKNAKLVIENQYERKLDRDIRNHYVVTTLGRGQSHYCREDVGRMGPGVRGQLFERRLRECGIFGGIDP